jgi:hypothetical protein
MRLAHTHVSVLVLAITVVACGGADGPDGVAAEAIVADQPVAVAPTPAPSEAPTAGTGTAQVKLSGGGADIDGSFPTTICGGTFGVDAGVAYQVQAGEWKITVGSGERVSGEVPLNDASGDVNVAVTANGPGVQLVRGPRNGGSLRISEDFDRADADLELRPLLGGETVRLVATFTCG